MMGLRGLGFCAQEEREKSMILSLVLSRSSSRAVYSQPRSLLLFITQKASQCLVLHEARKRHTEA
jgi:hypothetical protein